MNMRVLKPPPATTQLRKSLVSLEYQTETTSAERAAHKRHVKSAQKKLIHYIDTKTNSV